MNDFKGLPNLVGVLSSPASALCCCWGGLMLLWEVLNNIIL